MIYAFFGGILLLILSYLGGKKKGSDETKTKIKGQVIIEQQRAEKAETERDLAVESARIVRENTANGQALNTYFDEFEAKVEEAKAEGNADFAIEAARVLAEKAQAWKQRNK